MRNCNYFYRQVSKKFAAAQDGLHGNLHSSFLISRFSLKFLSSFLLPLSSFLFLSSCGAESGTFRMKGSFKGFNQGELYVYSIDGGIRKMDTIQVAHGEFTYQIPLDTAATFVLVFPNFSEIPVFGASGATAEINGDVSHLKEIKVEGTEENEQMTTFRLRVSEAMPPEAVKEAAAFIKKYPKSLGSLYLLNKYFIQNIQPDYRQAYELADTIQKANPDNRQLSELKKQLEGLKDLTDKGRLPKFTSTDIKGKPVSSADLYAKVNVITTWSTWNYESMNIQRQLKSIEKAKGVSKLKIVSFCLDASVKDCQKRMDQDSITWSNVCDGRMWQSPALIRLGLNKVPDNIVTDSQGKIIAHSLPSNEFRKKIEELIDK